MDCYIAAKKESLKPIHITKRLDYATKYIDWTLNEWANIIMFDEFTYTSGDPGQVKVWGPRN